jgi:hypothetical protein
LSLFGRFTWKIGHNIRTEKGFDFTGHGLSAGGIEGTVHVDFEPYMIRK